MTKEQTRKTSQKRGKQAPVFVENINMETQTVYKTDGSIDIYPCDFELGKNIVSGKNRASQRGRMTTDDNGTSHFTPYAVTTRRRYELIKAVKNAKLMKSEGRLVLHVSVPFKDNAYEELLNTILLCVEPTPEVIDSLPLKEKQL